MKVRVTVTIEDCDVETFRCGGKGGQNVQKRDTGVRIVHRPSGAVGESREERQQIQNKRTAFRRMAESPRFKAWAAMELAAKEEGYRSLEAKVDDLMREENLRVEYGDSE
jgi:protein subunit release factor A